MADESFNKAGEERKKNRWKKKAYANLLDDAISVGNQIKADLNRHRTQNHIRLNSMCMALHSALHILSLFLFVFSDFTDLKMLFHITYSLNIPGCSRPVPLTQMFWRFKYNRAQRLPEWDQNKVLPLILLSHFTARNTCTSSQRFPLGDVWRPSHDAFVHQKYIWC